MAGTSAFFANFAAIFEMPLSSAHCALVVLAASLGSVADKIVSFSIVAARLAPIAAAHVGTVSSLLANFARSRLEALNRSVLIVMVVSLAITKRAVNATNHTMSLGNLIAILLHTQLARLGTIFANRTRRSRSCLVLILLVL